MEPIKRHPQHEGPNHANRRPVFSDFASRPVSKPSSPQQSPRPTPSGASFSPKTVVPPQPHGPSPASLHTSYVETEIAPVEDKRPLTPASTTKKVKERDETAHAGWVGLVVFIVLIGLLFSSLLPGKILENFPGSSVTDSSGDEVLACLTDLGPMTTTQTYTSKLGFPVVYNYAITSTQQATCGTTKQKVTSGHTSQFNPLGGAIDLAICLAVAIGAAKLWRRVFGVRD